MTFRYRTSYRGGQAARQLKYTLVYLKGMQRNIRYVCVCFFYHFGAFSGINNDLDGISSPHGTKEAKCHFLGPN